jgi:hypothetical protein
MFVFLTWVQRQTHQFDDFTRARLFTFNMDGPRDPSDLGIRRRHGELWDKDTLI